MCAATRFLTLAKSPWDWDEALFCLGMRDYDVSQHHPHPPGFPVFIAAAKVMRLVATDDFRALQGVAVFASLLVFPAVFLFARELRLRFSTAVIAGVFFAFLPNVWFFGGTAFSDIPSIVLVLFAAALLLRGAHDHRAYWLGTLLLALSVGMRPQNLLLGLAPGILATIRRRPAEILVAVLIGAAVVGMAFGGAMAATGSPDTYIGAVRDHGRYITSVDSWQSPGRPPLWRLTDRFFTKQYQQPTLGIVATLFVIASIAGSIRERSRPMLLNVLTFAPFAIVALLMLDRYSVNRFSIGYQPMFAILAADGMWRVARWSAHRLASHPQRTLRLEIALETALAAVLTGAFMLWAAPAFSVVRNEASPPAHAVRSLRRYVNPRVDQLYVAHEMVPFVDALAPEWSYKRLVDGAALPLGDPGPAWILKEGNVAPRDGILAVRARDHLWNIARRHYFSVTLGRVERRASFASGWYAPESSGAGEWRWMKGNSLTVLPPAEGPTRLLLQVGLPGESVAGGAIIRVRLNGREVDSLPATAEFFERSWEVTPAARGARNELELSVDRTATPSAGDPRELGLRLQAISWGPA